MAKTRPGAEFFALIPETARVLVLDLGFLGDTIHLIPALWAIRQARPRARIEVMVAEHIKSILEVCPWLDAVHGYPRYPKGPKWHQDLGRVQALRRTQYDVVLNLNGSDRSSLLTRATGAPLRLGRVPPKVPWFWTRCYTHTVDVPHATQAVYKQRWDTLAAAGFPLPKEGPVFAIKIPAEVEKKLDGLLGSAGTFAHLSPWATQDEKELPLDVLAEFLNAAQAARPETGWVISTAPNARERGKLEALRGKLRFAPRAVFAGDLNLVELAGVIQRAKLHAGGDSGALHVALMTGTPTLSWFRDYAGRVEWQPAGAAHRSVLGQPTAAGLVGITAGQLTAEFCAGLDAAKADGKEGRR
jgi:ADP-heptose:LPS heptosyltransferase